MKYQVTYKGFLQTVIRTFDSKERAIQWVRQVGVERIATIKPIEQSFSKFAERLFEKGHC